MRINAPTAEEMDAFTCPITLEKPINVAVTPCGHLFDSDALLAWVISSAPNCPVCRGPVGERDITLLDPTEKPPDFAKIYKVAIFALGKDCLAKICGLATGSGKFVVKLCQDLCEDPSLKSEDVLPLSIPTVFVTGAVIISSKVARGGTTTMRYCTYIALEGMKAPKQLCKDFVLGENSVPLRVCGDLFGLVTTLLAFHVNEKTRASLLSDPTTSTVAKRIYNLSLNLGHCSMILGNPALALGEYLEAPGIREVGGAMVATGAVVSTAASVLYKTKKQWDLSVSKKHFVKKVTPDLIKYSAIAMCIYIFALTVLSDFY